MAEIINLRLARKARNRGKAEQNATENRALHGRTGAERQHRQAEAERAARQFDAHQRDKP